MSQSDTSVHDKTVIQQTSDTQSAEPAVGSENVTGIRTSSRERSYTEKCMQYEVSQQEVKSLMYRNGADKSFRCRYQFLMKTILNKVAVGEICLKHALLRVRTPSIVCNTFIVREPKSQNLRICQNQLKILSKNINILCVRPQTGSLI